MATVKEYTLNQDQELRFEIETANTEVHLRLKRGTAEIFGAELVTGKTYEFKTGARIAVFTWQGCVVEVKGDPDSIYTASETPMVVYMNCHGAFEAIRHQAEKLDGRGPIAMVVGPKNVGKSTICRILLNYAVRVGRKPIFVDLDVNQGQITIPGTIAALPVEGPSSVDGSFTDEASLVYNFGHMKPTTNGALYSLLVQDLAATVREKLDANRRIRASGVVINTCSWKRGERYEILLSSAKALEVDVILVVNQERLYHELLRDMPKSTKVVLVPKSGGVAESSEEIRSETRSRVTREYFYGTPSTRFHPHLLYVKYSEVKIFKIGVPALPESCLPIGMKENHNSMTKLVLLQPSVSLANHILAISFADKEDEVVSSHVAGFVCVTDVDVEGRILKILSPLPGPLPSHILVLSDLLFIDKY